MLKNQIIASDTDEDFKYFYLLAHDSIASSNLGEQQLFHEQSTVYNLSNSTHSHEVDSHENSEIFSHLVMDFIDQMLMEEDMEDKLDLLQSHPALEATERPFYEILGEKYPPSPDQPPLLSNPSSESSESHRSHHYNSSCITDVNEFADNDPAYSEITELLHPQIYVDFSNPFLENLPASQFEKGLKEAIKFIPREDKLVVDVGAVEINLPQEPEDESASTKINTEDDKRGRRHKSRHQHHDSDMEEQRNSKQYAVSFEEPPVSSEMLDMVLLCADEKFPKVISSIREAIQNEAAFKNSSEITDPTKYGESQNSRKKKHLQEEVVDFQILLMNCAQTVASGDHKRAYELLRQIRHHSSPYGDASQRVAYYFCNGLEARLAGTGIKIYHAMFSRRMILADVLKAYQLYLSASPFKQVSYSFSNRTIMDAIENATRVHILDFGTFLGFQWPAFFKMLSTRTGGPPKLRITAIDKPMPGFRPTAMIEETGRRLADYAERFGVRFEYNVVASKPDEVKLEDIHLDEEEFLVVNCVFQLNSLGDETMAMGVDCSKDKFLRIVRMLNPALFVSVAGNGNYGAPFFVTRFREALYHFSAMFDMMEMTTPRENEQRLLVERDLYARFAINVIACEGTERVDWPETYKQSQVRFLRAGFHQLPINKRYANKVKSAVRTYYHKDFSVDVDGRWLLQGWRGRIFVALSAWKPR